MKACQPIILIFFILTGNFCFAQKNIQQSSTLHKQNITSRPNQVDCTPLPIPNTCTNYIQNNNFTPSSNPPNVYDPSNINHFTNPFFLNLVPNWYSTHGTPQVYDGVNGITFFSPPPPFPSTGCAYLLAGVDENGTNTYGEGIVQKIPVLQVGKNYLLSFFKRIRNTPIQPSLDFFDIYAMKCSDYQLFNPSTNTYPVPPVNAKKIYCETQVTNKNWQQVFVKFTVDDNYDMIWIFPHQNYPQNQTTSGIYFAYPQIIDDFSITAGPVPMPIPPNCSVTIGPAIPNCNIIANTIYIWYGPAGQVINAPANQQIQVDASISANVGNWTLRMTVPNVITTNNTCSQNSNIEATVNVPICQSCNPVISPSGPIDYYTPVDGAPNGRLLTSNIMTANQWYFNNVAITNANGYTYDIKNEWGNNAGGDYYTINNGCKSNTVHVDFKHYGYGRYGEEDFNRLGAKIHPVQTSNYYCYNTTNNFIQQFDLGPTATYKWNFPVYFPTGGVQNISLTPGSDNSNSNQAQVNISGPAGSTLTYVQGIANLNGREIILDYYHTLSHPIYTSTNQQVCANAGQYIRNFGGSSIETIPGGSGFDWEEYDFGLSGIIFSGPGAGQNSVTIPGRSTPQAMTVKFSGSSFVQKHFYYNWGGCYEEKYNVTLLNGCKTNEKATSEIKIYPNPSINKITVSSTEAINYIEISDLMNPLLKRIKVNNTKSVLINVQDLKPGIYNCKITTDKGVENQKLIIQR